MNADGSNTNRLIRQLAGNGCQHVRCHSLGNMSGIKREERSEPQGSSSFKGQKKNEEQKKETEKGPFRMRTRKYKCHQAKR